jgi:hypothetical protein
MTPDLNTVTSSQVNAKSSNSFLAHTQRMRNEMAHDPEVARQFLKEIGLLDADGDGSSWRVKRTSPQLGTRHQRPFPMRGVSIPEWTN